MYFDIRATDSATTRCKSKLQRRGISPEFFKQFLEDIWCQINGRSEEVPHVTDKGVLLDNGKAKEKQFSYKRNDFCGRIWFQFDVEKISETVTYLHVLELDVRMPPP